MKLLFILILVLPVEVRPVVVTGQRWYVAPTGNNDAAGTIEQPWRTIAYAARTVQPGSTVFVRGGVYAEQIQIAVSGADQQHPIVFQSFPGETAIIDGSSLTPTEGTNALIAITDQSWITIDGFELRNLQSASASIVPTAIQVRGAAHDLTIRNNRIHTIRTSAPDGNAHALAVYGTGVTPIRTIMIDHNQLWDLVLGASEALTINGNVEGWTIANNLVHDSNNIGIDAIGFEGIAPNPTIDQARNGLITGNTVYHIDSSTNPAYRGEHSAAGIYIDGGREIVVERNRSWDNDVGIELGSEHLDRSTRAVIARNNWVWHNRIAGIAVGGYDPTHGGALDCAVVNNTLVENDSLQQNNGEIWLQLHIAGLTIANNILVTTPQGLLLGSPYTDTMTTLVDHQFWSVPPGTAPSWLWHGTTYDSLATYQQASHNDAASLLDDPHLVNAQAADFHLRLDSPARGAGLLLAVAGDQDIDGDQRSVGISIDSGADEVAWRAQLPLLSGP